MADEATQNVSTVAADEPTSVADAPEQSTAAAPSDEESNADNVVEEAPAPETIAPAVSADTTAPDTDTAMTGTGNETADTTVEAPTTTTPTNGASDSAKKNNAKRRPSSVPEHKGKKLGKKKSMANLHLNVHEGEYWYARMKGHPDWPSIICNEQLLPESLLVKRPVSAAAADGTFREDYRDGGKNVKDRRYPVMFLSTNEFAWIPNTDLKPLNMDDLKKKVANEDNKKMSKALWEAFKIAAEEHPIEYFTQLVEEHADAVAKDREAAEKAAEEKAEKAREKAEKAAEKAEKAVKKEKRKSKAADDDVEMADAGEGDSETPKPPKGKKRPRESDGAAPEKLAKTPKLKVNGPKAPAETPAKKTKPRVKKPKAPAEAEEAQATPPEPELTEEEQYEKLKKSVFFFRHKLQKGFLTRDQVPKEEEMPAMAQLFTQTEGLPTLDAAMIRETKIHKVCKSIAKLPLIPKNEEFNFRTRAQNLFDKFNEVLVTADAAAPSKTDAATTNGVKPETSAEPKAASEEAKADSVAKDAKPATELEATPTADKPLGNGATRDADVSMADAETKQIETEVSEPSKEEKLAAETTEAIAVAAE